MNARLEPDVVLANFDDTAHRHAIVAVLDTYASDPVGGGKPLAEDVKGRLVPLLRAQPNSLALLAFEQARPIGVAICFFGLSTFAARPLLNVHDLAVVPTRRGRGVGRALLAAAERLARERGCCKLTLEVQEDNRPARTLYERFGFADVVYGDSAPTRFLAKPLD